MSAPFRLPPDYHSHTHLCQHADGVPIDYARAAVECGLVEIACTDHAPAPEPFDPSHRMRMDQFDMYREWVREAQAIEGVRVLFGIEADYYEGCEEFLELWLTAQSFDYVLGSVHYNRYDRDNGHALSGVYDPHDITGSWSAYFDRIRQMANSGLYDVASHLDLPKRFGPTPPIGVIERIVKPALDSIAAAGMGIEINTSGFGHDPGEPYPSQPILGWARERDIPITFGSDAHTPSHLGHRFADAIRLARAAGYTEHALYRQRQLELSPLIEAPDSATVSAG